MSLADVLGAEAEQSEYARVVSKRIGELVAEKIDTEGFVNASDDDLRNLATTILALVMNELGDEALVMASDTAHVLGFGRPNAHALDLARQRALESNANRLYSALEEERAKAQKAAARNDGVVSESLGLGIVSVLGIAFADAAQGLATDLPVELNGAMAEGIADGAAGAAGDAVGAGDVGVATAATAAADEAGGTLLDSLAGLAAALGGGIGTSEGTLTWITRSDDSVCQEDGPSVKTPSGYLMPAGAGTSCEARHGVTLPASDWISEGFPRDSRLLCSRFKRPRCRCLLSVSADVPDSPMNIGPDVAKGRARGEAEQLDLTDAHLQGISVTATGQKVDPNLWNLTIRVSKRPVPVGAP
jgi:hypothetical protein